MVKGMYSVKKVLQLILSGAAILAASLAVAQDFNQLKGNNGRSGKNNNPALYGPGIANVTWFQPRGVNLPGAIIRNNTSTAVARAGIWNAPAPGTEASFIYNVARSGNPALDLLRGTQQNPAYEYATNVASNPGSHLDPRQGATASFTWVLDPSTENATTPSLNYQVYVWLPNGPTTDYSTFALYPQRYFVYEITYGDPANQKTYIDVVDRQFAGQGWVRLGSGGKPTSQIFTYVPGQPITVRLYNTIWRDDFDQLLDIPGDVVYADAAMIVPDNGSYVASPVVSQITTGTGPRTQTIGAANKNSVSVQNGADVTISNGEVTAYNYATGNIFWRWSPLEGSKFLTTVDNTAATASAAWVTDNIVPFHGPDYLAAPIQGTDNVNPEAVTYSPTLQDGDYQIQVYCGGDTSADGLTTEPHGQSTVVKVLEGANPPVLIPIDQSVPGWVTISNRRFAHSSTAPLRVQITNYSANPADIGKLAYADSVRFSGSVNSTITSTPVQQKVWLTPQGGGPKVEKDVVFVATEDGHIYCLDAAGNPDGTTTTYWAYPSIMQSGTDPNEAVGEDGGATDYPTSGFGLSSPTVVRTDPNTDLIYIAAQNGRVYCINSDGRGDYDPATGVIGTTTRKWSYPNDYPVVKAPPLGNSEGVAFLGSVAYGESGTGRKTIFVPSMEGRVYALDAVGGPNKTTTMIWSYPNRIQPTLGPVATTPAVDFGRVYFGTARKDDTAQGQFYALNIGTGSVDWSLNYSDDFLGGPTTASAAELGIANNMVYASNQNRYIYGFDADNGAELWKTDELNTTVRGNLTFTYLSTYNTLGTVVPFPLVMVPTEDGRFDGLFARPADVDVDGFKLGWEYTAASDTVTASMAVGYNFMYAGDGSGNLYAFSDAAYGGGYGSPPGTPTITANNPLGASYRNAKITFITRDAYQKLRESVATDPTGDTGNLTYDQLPLITSSHGAGYEWGETVYMLVYDFPFDTTTPNGTATNPPIVQFQIAVDGASMRQFSVQAKKWNQPPAPPADQEAYAVLAFPIQGSGPSSLPPGSAKVTFSITTSALNDNAQPSNVRLNPNNSSKIFRVANPIGLSMPNPSTGVEDITNRSIGRAVDPLNPERLVNGSQTVLGGVDGARLGNSEGVVSHGSTGTGTLWITDMSMMTLLRGPTRGLDAVRMTHNDLAWQGGAASVFHPITDPTYAGFEDLPVNFPNTSLDYPNISSSSLRASKDPFGTPENLMVSPSGVSLTPPNNVDVNAPLTRLPIATPAQLYVDVPRFQPANNLNNGTSTYFLDSANEPIPSGYSTRLQVFVDSNGDGQFNSIAGRREAYRAFTTGVAVAVDERLEITTPTVDLGPLAGGSLYSPNAPGSATWSTADASPWSSLLGYTYPAGTRTTANDDYQSLFKPFSVEAPGNVNALNVRVVKGVISASGGAPWPIYSNSVDDLGWLDASLALYSDIDEIYGLAPTILLQKARVGDVAPATLSTNPRRRFNGNLGVTQSLLFPSGPPPAAPRISLAPPIGFPTGLFSQTIHVFDKVDAFGTPDYVHVDNNNNPIEVMSSPGLTLKYTERENRATTSFTKYTTSMLDYPQAYGPGDTQRLTFANLQPSGVRALNGDLLVAYTSTQPAFDAPHPTDTDTNPQYRIYLNGLDGTVPTAGGSNPLNDLYSWTPGQTNRWFKQVSGPFPAGPYNGYFSLSTGESLIAGTEHFGAPSFPGSGFRNPLDPNSPFANTFMAFVGEAQKQGPDGRAAESHIMVATIAPVGNGTFNATGVASMPFDPNTPKGKPSLYQSGSNAVIFYTTSGNGEGGLYYTVVSGGGVAIQFSKPVQVNLGSGFESVGSPSVALRPYRGPGSVGGNNNLVEFSFVAKLRGRTNSEVYLGRMNTTGAANAPFQSLYNTAATNERLTAAREPGVYQAAGVVWNPRFGTQLMIDPTGSGTAFQPVTTGGPTIDRATGIMKYTSLLGGEVYLDPNLGTVRFANGLPQRQAVIALTYQPRFYRVSENTTAGHSGVNLLFDDRIAGDVSPFSYWFRATGGTLSNVGSTDTPRSDRFFFTYNRAAAGGGETARPLWKSLRFGIGLPKPILTDTNGNITNFTISPAPSGYVQVDPAAGAIYFESVDEGRTFTIACGASDGTTQTVTAGASLMTEKAEQLVPIDQAVNESAMTPFLDPFDTQRRRPGLIWMFFTSTRTGSSDIYFQTMAPRFTPVISGH